MSTAEKLIREEKYKYSDYENWQDSENWEIISGKAYMMAPSPTIKHQNISGNIYNEFKNYVKGKSCKVFYEIDVVLSEEDIVKPDIMVVCDKEKLGEKNIKGAPDLIVEVLSPSTSRRDKVIKLELYKKYGVKEYWIADPVYREITVHYFTENRSQIYYTEDEAETSEIGVKIFNDELKLDMKYIFEE